MESVVSKITFEEVYEIYFKNTPCVEVYYRTYKERLIIN